MVSLIIGALIGGIITWLLGDCSNIINQPTVYGPPPIDSTQTVSQINNEYTRRGKVGVASTRHH